MKTRDEILTEVATAAKYRNLAGRIASPRKLPADDLLQDTLLILAEYDPEKLTELYYTVAEKKGVNLFELFIVRTMIRICSPDHKFCKAHKYGGAVRVEQIEYKTSAEESNIQEDQLTNRCEELILKECTLTAFKSPEDKFVKTIYQYYVEHGSVRKVAALTNIPYKTIHNVVSRRITELKQIKEQHIKKLSQDERYRYSG